MRLFGLFSYKLVHHYKIDKLPGILAFSFCLNIPSVSPGGFVADPDYLGNFPAGVSFYQ